MKRTDKDLQYRNHVANLKAVIKDVRILVLVLMGIGGLNAQTTPNNLTVLNRMYETVLDSLTGQIAEPELVIPVEKNESATFLRAGWIDYWTSTGRQGIEDTTSHRLVIENFDARIKYLEEGIGLFGFNRNIKRQIHFHLKGWIESTNPKKVGRAFNLNKTWQDTILSTDLSVLEKAPYSFCKGRFQSRSVWTKYIEPALVVISVGVSIYLFFTVRS